MLTRTRIILMIYAFCFAATMAFAQAPPCPGFNSSHNVNLACEIATAVRVSTSGSHTLGQLTPTVAAELSQLPVATAISGSGFTFSAHGTPITTDSLGTILTQRGETLGKHKYFVSFNYQRFRFDSIDGISLKHLDTVNQAVSDSTTITVRANNRVDLLVDQFTAIGSFGLTDKIDLSLLVPFAKVTLKTLSSGTQTDSRGTPPVQFVPSFFDGSANGVGDIAVNIKAHVLTWNQERASLAVGGEVRFPTGDETNFLGTGAYGVKPYVVLSRSGKKITPNINLGYQWNGTSSLFVNSRSGAQLNLPSSFLYSGGIDYSVMRRLTLSAEFLGQAVINGPRLGRDPANQSITTLSSSYAMDNIGVGFKVKAYKGLLITGDALVKLDDGGLRSKVVPLVGISYKFKR